MKNKRIVGLDTLRCFAIALVVIYHCFPGVLPGGFLAVEIFFAVSGFLIGWKLIRTSQEEKAKFGGIKSFGKFVWGRLKRFYPVLLFCMILTLSLAYFADVDLLTAARPNTLYAGTFTTNIMSIINGHTYENSLIPNLFNQTWFLALELQVCLICFLVMAGFFRLWPAKEGKAKRRCWQLMFLSLAIGLVSFGLMAVYGGWFKLYDRAYFGPDSHIGAFFLGVALAALMCARDMRGVKKSRRWIPIATLGLSIVGVGVMAPFVTYASSEAFSYALPATAVLSLIMIVSIVKLQRSDKEKVAKPLAVLEYVGSLSFAIYLLHYGLNILLPDLLEVWPAEVIPYVVIVVSVALAILLKHVIVPFSQKHKVWFYVLVAGSLVLPVMSLIKAPEKSSIEENLAMATSEREEAPVASEPVAVDYTGAVELANLLNGDVMKFFDGVEKFAKPYPVMVRGGGATTSLAGRARYNTPNLSRTSELNGRRVMVIGDSVVLGATNNIYNTIPGVFVDALESRNMTDAINLLAGYRADNGGNLPYIIVIGLVTNYYPFGMDTLQAVMDAAGPGHQFVFMTGYCGDYSREAQNNTIKAMASSNGNVHVGDWVPVVLSDLGGYTYADHTHLTPAGRQAYANLISGIVSGL